MYWDTIHRLHAAAKTLFDSSHDMTPQVEDTYYGTDNTLWAEPAVAPSYIYDESTADTTPTTPNTTHDPSSRSLWAAPAEPPSSSFSALSQSTTELSQQSNLPANTTNHPVLGHYRHNLTPNSPLNLPLLSPIRPIYDDQHMCDTHIYNPPNNIMMNVPSELTPYCNTYIFHPNLSIS